MTYIPWEATTLLVSKIDHLKLLLKEVLTVEDCQIQRARLHYCIRYHQEILRQVVFFSQLCEVSCRIFQDLRGCFKKTFSVLVLTASIILSCLCAQMLKVPPEFFRKLYVFLEFFRRYCSAFLWLYCCHFFAHTRSSEGLG